MYLQITTKCNFHCAHCCYSCTMRGKHGDYNTIIGAIAFARNQDEESIAIGGGEPTLHPRFFDILHHCLEDFNYVWMATNGSQTKAMHRLANIIDGSDYDSFEPEDYCTCGPDADPDDCYCEPDDLIYQEGKLSVALSQDRFHDDINPRVEALWRKKAARHCHSHFEIRDVSNHVIAEGRAKKTGSGWEEGCVCPDLFIRPDGEIKLCGCTRSPVIGDVWNGIESKWEKIIYDHEGFNDERCYKALRRK